MYWRLVAILLLVVDHSTLSQEVSRGHRKRPSQKEACPHLEKRPGDKLQVYMIKINGTERQCCGCPAGYRVAGLCSKDNITDTVCESCEDGTYITDMAHDKQTCNVDDLICRVGLDKINAEYDSAPRCECPPGQFMIGNDMCQPHSTCPPGEGVDRLGTSERNTACKKCRSGYESLNDSATDSCVRKTKNKTPQTKTGSNNMTAKANNTTTRANATLCPSPEKQDVLFYMGLSHVICMLVTAIVCVFATWAVMKPLDTRQIPCCQSLQKRFSRCCYARAQDQSKNRSMAILSLDCIGGDNVEEDTANLRPDHNKLEAGIADSNETIAGSADLLLGGAGQQTVQSEVQQQRNAGASPVVTGSAFNSLFPAISPYHRTMNEMKLKLQNDVDTGETYDLYRYFTSGVVTSIQQSIYIKGLRQGSMSNKEKFCVVFEDLVKILKCENFNPPSVYQHFYTKVENHHLAEIVEPFLNHDWSNRNRNIKIEE